MSAPVPAPSAQAQQVAPHGLAPALHALAEAVDATDAPTPDGWRWTVRQRLASLRDALVGEVEAADDGWLAARSGGVLRERNALLGRLSTMGPRVLENADVERVRTELRRLVVDVSHHVQRLHDLAYDAVELELGGSE